MKNLLFGILLFAIIALGLFYLLYYQFRIDQGVALVAALLIAGISEWLFHKFVKKV
ncbi:hypothetical protein [Alteribacter populi]|uniref:hypothetical protein n=1 Tax=Alteribacter populi TaxID=2011011 RepID=UPI0012FDFBC3|nr:hypothetical protein [Alteribacter populi]